jgi:hypothetical protein
MFLNFNLNHFNGKKKKKKRGVAAPLPKTNSEQKPCICTQLAHAVQKMTYPSNI